MVAGQADRRRRSRARSTQASGLGAVADKVAQAPHLLAFGGLDRLQHGLEGLAVAVDIGDDGYSDPWCSREGTRVTVSLVRHRSRYGYVPATLLALGAAELGGRLLRPRQGAAKSVEADVRSHFSDAEIQRGARYARPQVALGIARSGLALGAMAVAVDRIPSVLPARLRGSLLGGAAAGAGFGLVGSLASLPLSIVARRRLDRGRSDHPVVAWVGGRPGQGPDDLRDDLGRRRGRDGCRDPPLSTELVVAGGRGLGRHWIRVRGARPGRARSRVQRLHAASRGRHSHRCARPRLRRRRPRRRDLLDRRQPPDHRGQRVRHRPRANQARRAVRHAARSLQPRRDPRRGRRSARARPTATSAAASRTRRLSPRRRPWRSSGSAGRSRCSARDGQVRLPAPWPWPPGFGLGADGADRQPAIART